MFGNLLAPEIEELIAARDFATIREVFEDWDAPDLAELVAELSDESRVVLFRLLPKDVASDTFAYCEIETQEQLVHDMAKEQIASILNEMSADDRTQFFEELPANVVQELINQLSAEERAIALTLLNYPEDSVGRVMTPDYVIIKKHWTVQQALEHIRTHGKDSETLNVLYVTENGTLIDEIHIREILLSPPDMRIEDLMDYKAEALLVTDPQEKAVAEFRRLDRYALPVVDGERKMLGIITADDVLDIAEEQATEEMQRFGGVEVLEDSYAATPFLELVRKRGLWLVVLFIGEMLTASAMGSYEEQIQRTVVLALFVPLIISSGGNSGSQAATLIIRALALNEISLGDWRTVFKKEAASGLMLGGLLGLIGFIRIAAWQGMYDTYGVKWMQVGFTVSSALVGVVMWGTISGSMLPFILKRVGLDPATSSAPFVATLVDVFGIVIYFSIASLLL